MSAADGFVPWLLTHKDKDDAYGDLARDIEDDECLPRPCPSPADLRVHMVGHGACRAALDTLWRARLRYARVSK